MRSSPQKIGATIIGAFWCAAAFVPLGQAVVATRPTTRPDRSSLSSVKDAQRRVEIADQVLAAAREDCLRRLRTTTEYSDRAIELYEKDQLLAKARHSGDPAKVDAAQKSQERSMHIMADLFRQALAADPAVTKAEAELKRAQAAFKASTQPGKVIPSTEPSTRNSASPSA